MRYQSTVFGQLLKAVPRGWFDREAERLRDGRSKRTLSAWGHMVTMVLSQAAGLCSLREVERMIEHHGGVASHLGLQRVRRATLGDANARRPAALFEAVAARLAGEVSGGGLGKEALRLIDATRLFAGRKVAAWATGAVKLHLAFDPGAARPVWFAVTSERVHDLTAARNLPIEPGVTYVFDKGYYDFAFWARLDTEGCRFVTRLKKNSPVRILAERDVAGGILFDRIAYLSQRLQGQRRNPYGKPVRVVGLRTDNGRELVLISNDLDTPADEIAAIYKARWQVELFFKWIKQNLALGHFLGTSRNAVTIQIMAALIVYLLLRAAAITCRAAIGLQAVARLLPATALARRSLHSLFKPPDKNPPETHATAQSAFIFA